MVFPYTVVQLTTKPTAGVWPAGPDIVNGPFVNGQQSQDWIFQVKQQAIVSLTKPSESVMVTGPLVTVISSEVIFAGVTKLPPFEKPFRPATFVIEQGATHAPAVVLDTVAPATTTPATSVITTFGAP
jgi:hypothetical protein